MPPFFLIPEGILANLCMKMCFHASRWEYCSFIEAALVRNWDAAGAARADSPLCLWSLWFCASILLLWLQTSRALRCWEMMAQSGWIAFPCKYNANMHQTCAASAWGCSSCSSLCVNVCRDGEKRGFKLLYSKNTNNKIYKRLRVSLLTSSS